MKPDTTPKPQAEPEQLEKVDGLRQEDEEKTSDPSTRESRPPHSDNKVPNKVQLPLLGCLKRDIPLYLKSNNKQITFDFVMTLIAFSMVFVGSQLVTLLFATLTTLIGNDLKAGSKSNWLFSANLVATAATAPFVGAFSDLYGRKTVTICGAALSLLGMILFATTPNADGYIAGQAFCGMSVAIQELMAIVAVSELVPVSKRGLYVAIIISGFIPFAPGTLYGQWIAQHNWRYNACLLGVWNALTIVMLAIFYWPPPRLVARTQGKRKTLHQIDVVGGLLSITGIVLFLVGLNWGGQTYSWNSAPVISTLVLGIAFCVAFAAWEIWGAQYPLFPRKMIQAPSAFACIIVVTFAAGVGYVPILIFWTVQATAVYGADHYHLGLYTLPFGCCILAGAIISALLLSTFRRHMRWILTGFCIMQVTGTACMAAVDPHNINTVWAPLIFSSLGAGGVLVPNQIIVTAITPDDLIGTATALSLSVRGIGQVIGLTLFYNRFLHITTKNAFSIMLPVALKTGIFDLKLIESIVLGVTATPWSELAKTIPQIDNAVKYDLFAEALVTLFSKSFPLLYYISIAFGGVACIAAFLIGDLSDFMNEHVAVHL